MPQRIELTADDGVKIAGIWVAAPTTIGAAVLLHMYPSSKESWAAFQSMLARRGIASLAIDLRGHGESTRTAEGVKIDYRKFGEEETESTVNDVRAAYEWIRSRGVDEDRIAVVGASIGANLALKFLAGEPRVPAAALLSPGLDYHGIRVMDFVDCVASHQSVWIAASKGDDDRSVGDSERIMEALGSEVKVFVKLDMAGHGTRIFDADAVIMGQVADWLRDRIQAAG
jgi:alpha-beta hydrolase superfamily lysophospholipase